MWGVGLRHSAPPSLPLPPRADSPFESVGFRERGRERERERERARTRDSERDRERHREDERERERRRRRYPFRPEPVHLNPTVLLYRYNWLGPEGAVHVSNSSTADPEGVGCGV